MSADKTFRPTRAMILAAGLGARMRPLTETVPKPLIEIDSRPLIDHALERLVDAGITEVVVNLHHLADKIETHLHLKARKQPRVRFLREAERLETGGGVKNALPMLGSDPFYVVNSDAFWLNGPLDTLGRMAATWDDKHMDGLLLLHSAVDAYGYRGVGDFCADEQGLLTRRPESELSPWLFTGIQILHPRLFDGAPEGAFSLNVLYDKAIEAQRLYGIIHDGEWFHVGTRAGLEAAERYMHIRFAGIKHR